MSDWNLSDFSKALDRQSQLRRLQLLEFNQKLEGKCILFLPEADAPEGHGVGWFVGDTGFFAYRRHSNGYDPLSRQIIEFELIKALLPHMPGA